MSTPALPAPQGSPGSPRSSGAARTEPRFDPTTWRGALITMTALLAVLWIVQIVNAANHDDLVQYGLKPRDLDGLVGIFTMPFLHASFGHLLANSAPFVLIGWVVLLSGVRPLLISSAIIVVVGGLATWAVAPSVGPHGSVVGVSGLVMGWLGYLLGRAYFSRRILWIVVAVLVVFFFGTLLGSLLPSVGSDISWQGHLAGFASGVFAAFLMHPRPHRGRRGDGPAPGVVVNPRDARPGPGA